MIRPTASPIAGYEGWPEHALAADAFVAGDPASQQLADVLGLRRRFPTPDVERVASSVSADGIRTTELRWQLPYGPPTLAWELRPDASGDSLPGALALHPHGGRRSVGAEALVTDGSGESIPLALALARSGFVVLAHDTFSWASRRFDLSDPPLKLAHTLAAQRTWWAAQRHVPTDDEVFDTISSAHEDVLAKIAGSLGQTFAGMVLADDLVALDLLAGLPDVDSSRIAAIGFSGGGGRAHMLGALDDRVGAVVIACMMATFASLMPRYMETHSWLLHSPGLARFREWPELATVGSPRRLLALYGETDELFPLDGMRDAHHLLERVDGYDGRFFPSGHEFSDEMVQTAAAFLRAWASDSAR